MSDLPTPEMEAMLVAYEALNAAEKALKDATERAYPIGDEVLYTYTRSGREYAIICEVSCHYYDPGYIGVKNIETGKSRKIHAPSELKRGCLE